MEFSDLKGMFTEITARMHASVERVRRDMASVRTGRASVSLLDHVQVEAYGSKTVSYTHLTLPTILRV